MTLNDLTDILGEPLTCTIELSRFKGPFLGTLGAGVVVISRAIDPATDPISSYFETSLVSLGGIRGDFLVLLVCIRGEPRGEFECNAGNLTDGYRGYTALASEKRASHSFDVENGW